MRAITIPLLRPTLFTVLTLGLIGTWQVFDQVYIMSKGAPGKTTLTPAFLSYDQSINNGEWGTGTAMSFVLFAIIIVFTAVQTFAMRDRDRTHKERRGALGRALRLGNQRNPRAGGMP
jgi:multiple sugar transport system permease protein